MPEDGIERSGPCDRCHSTADLIPITTIVNGIEKKEWVCPDCEPEAREDEKPPLRTDGGTVEETEHFIVEEHDLDEPDWDTAHDGMPRPGPEFVCSVAEALEPDDEVIINRRSRSLTVLGFEEQLSQGAVSGSDWPYHILWLRGNGTEYRLRWSHNCEYTPRLHKESELETREKYSVKHGEMRKATRATTSGTDVWWICPVDVDRSDLSDWTLLRNVEGLNTRSADTGTEQSGGDSDAEM